MLHDVAIVGAYPLPQRMAVQVAMPRGVTLAQGLEVNAPERVEAQDISRTQADTGFGDREDEDGFGSDVLVHELAGVDEADSAGELPRDV
jgi:hypothetical protein